VFQKKLHPFIFAITLLIVNQFSICSNMPEKICNKTHIVFHTTPMLCACTLPCNTSSEFD